MGEGVGVLEEVRAHFRAGGEAWECGGQDPLVRGGAIFAIIAGVGDTG